MAFRMMSVCLVITFFGMCLCQDNVASLYSQQSEGAQASFQSRSATVQQIKLEDIERDSLANAAAYGQKTQQQSGKTTASAAIVQQQSQQQLSQAAAPQQQYYVQPYPVQQPQQQQQQQQQFYVQPYNAQQQQYLAQPYQPAFDYAGVQYMIINPNAYNPVNPIYQQYYVPAAQPSTVPEYVTKQSTPIQAQQEYKQQQAAVPAQAQPQYRQQFAAVAPSAQAQQEYKQQFSGAAVPSVQTQQEYKQQFAAQAQQEYKQQPAVAAPAQSQQQYVVPAPEYRYVQQPAAAASPAAASPVDFSYVTRHPAAAGAQFKAQPQQFQYNTVPQQFPQQQYYYTVPAAAAPTSVEQPRVQQSAKSQYSSGVKSTTPTPFKESFAYKFESSPPAPQQQPGSAYSTLRYSA